MQSPKSDGPNYGQVMSSYLGVNPTHGVKGILALVCCIIESGNDLCKQCCWLLNDSLIDRVSVGLFINNKFEDLGEGEL